MPPNNRKREKEGHRRRQCTRDTVLDKDGGDKRRGKDERAGRQAGRRRTEVCNKKSNEMLGWIRVILCS